MRNCILIYIVFLIFSSSPISAQELTISSCLLDKTDIISNYLVHDNNNNVCALIKIYAGEITRELSFKGNVVQNVLYNDSLYLVYVMNKTKRLSVYHPNCIPTTIDFTSFPDSKFGLAGGLCYVLSLIPSEKFKTNKSFPKGSRVISFLSELKMKRLTVNGEDWKIANNSSKRLVPYGRYTYEAISDDNKVIQGEFDLEPSVGSKIVKINFGQ